MGKPRGGRPQEVSFQISPSKTQFPVVVIQALCSERKIDLPLSCVKYGLENLFGLVMLLPEGRIDQLLYFPENCVWLLGLMVNMPVFHCKRGIPFFPKNATFFQSQVPEGSSSFYTRWSPYLPNLLVVFYELQENLGWIYGCILFYHTRLPVKCLDTPTNSLLLLFSTF